MRISQQTKKNLMNTNGKTFLFTALTFMYILLYLFLYEITDKRQVEAVFVEVTMSYVKARAKHAYQQQHYIPPPSILTK